MEIMKHNLLEARYYMEGETFELFCKRIASFIIEDSHPKYFSNKSDAINVLTNRLIKGEVIFNSPLLMNAGKKQPLTSACYVLPVSDSLVDEPSSIMDLQKLSAKIFKLGAGVGVDYSMLRPEGTPVKSGGTASGPVSFMHLIDTLAEVVKSGGKRRAAIMSTLRVDHPDIKKFITSKADNKSLSNTNISVMMTDEFMSTLLNKPKNSTITVNNIFDKESDAVLNVTEIWNTLIENAWATGDPGLVFIDTINKITNGIEGLEYAGVNACNEYSLYPYESCLIGTINLVKFISKDNKIDMPKLKVVVRDMVKYLDSIIDKAWYPDTKIKNQAVKYRRIGIGITGLGDLLIKLKIPYDSANAYSTAAEIMDFITEASIEMSEELTFNEDIGPFPEFKKFIAGSYYKLKNRPVKPRRNLAVTVIAPTGSTSIICGAECSGIEPMYAVAYKRMMRLDTGGNTWFDVVSPLFMQAMTEHKFTEQEILTFIPKIIANGGSIQNIEGIPDDIKAVFKTAHEISPISHLNMIASIQPYVENAISKTINLPTTATKEDIADLYIKAWKMQCKGITVFRDGCKSEQVYETSTPIPTHTKDERPDVLSGQTMRMELPQGSLYINITHKDNKPFELFAILGKSGLDNHAYCEALGRMVSLCLRSGISAEAVSKTLKGIRGRDWGLWGDEYIWSVPHALGVALEYSINKPLNSSIKEIITHCPECGGKMVIDNGCMKCLSCEYSKCSS